jgi:hypothetical protein
MAALMAAKTDVLRVEHWADRLVHLKACRLVDSRAERWAGNSAALTVYSTAALKADRWAANWVCSWVESTALQMADLRVLSEAELLVRGKVGSMDVLTVAPTALRWAWWRAVY